MEDNTSKNPKEGIGGRLKKLFAPENNCGCCCGDVKIVPKKKDEQKE
jgi:hypothetical protein